MKKKRERESKKEQSSFGVFFLFYSRILVATLITLMQETPSVKSVRVCVCVCVCVNALMLLNHTNSDTNMLCLYFFVRYFTSFIIHSTAQYIHIHTYTLFTLKLLQPPFQI